MSEKDNNQSSQPEQSKRELLSADSQRQPQSSYEPEILPETVLSPVETGPTTPTISGVALTSDREPASSIGLKCPTGASVLDPKLLEACIHCGLCLPACPTYLATGRETESPRGRIQLLRMWHDGEEMGPRMAEHLDSCLGCMGCQTACPSGVQYEKLISAARPHVSKFRDKRARRLMALAFSSILPNYPRLRFLGGLLRLYQQSKLSRLLPALPIPGRWKKRLAEWEGFLPQVPKFKPLPSQSWKSGEKSGEVHVFAGCVMDIFYNHVNHAAIRLLTDQRRIVRVPQQTCCGALAAHGGEINIAKDLAKQNIEFFEQSSGDIVVTSAGCGAMLKEYGELFEHEPEWAERAHKFSERIKDITESLGAGKFSSTPEPINMSVAYHAACHLSHVQKVKNPPVDLLKQIPGLKMIPLEEAEHCCGSAGIYNLLHTDMSLKVLDRKMAYLKETGAQAVVSTNPGCLLQLKAGIDQERLNMKVYHLVELLDESFTSNK